MTVRATTTQDEDLREGAAVADADVELTEAEIEALPRLFEGGTEISATLVEGSRDNARQTVEVVLITEGFGNSRDRHYYAGPVLKKAVADGIFEAATIYSNHDTPKAAQERQGQPRPWEEKIGRFLPGTIRALENAAGKVEVRGTALVANPLAWAYIKADPQIIEVSIDARGNTGPLQLIEGEGREGKPVEAFRFCRSVDFVGAAGARGRIERIAESFLESQVADLTEDGDNPDARSDEPSSGDEGSSTTSDTPANGGEATPDPAPEAGDGQAAPETPAEDSDSTDTGTDAAESTEDEVNAADADVEEGEWEPVSEEQIAAEVAEADAEVESEDDVEEARRGRRSGGRRGEIPSGRDTTPVRSEFGWGGMEDTTPDEIDGPVEKDHTGEHTHERLNAHQGGGQGKPSAGQLARAMEAELARRVEEAVDAAMDEAEASFEAERDELVAEHERALAQVEQRYAARELIREAARDPRQPLPDATRDALFTEFHDFFAEPVMEGDAVAESAEQVLEKAVVRRIDEKRAELSAVTEARVEAGGSGAPISESASASDDKDGKSDSSAGGRQAPLDDALDRELGIADAD